MVRNEFSNLFIYLFRKDSRRTCPTDSTKQCLHTRSQRLKQHSPGLQMFSPGPSPMLWLLAWWLCGSPNSGIECFSFVL